MPWQSPNTPQVGDHGSYYEHDATVVAVDPITRRASRVH